MVWRFQRTGLAEFMSLSISFNAACRGWRRRLLLDVFGPEGTFSSPPSRPHCGVTLGQYWPVRPFSRKGTSQGQTHHNALNCHTWLASAALKSNSLLWSNSVASHLKHRSNRYAGHSPIAAITLSPRL